MWFGMSFMGIFLWYYKNNAVAQRLPFVWEFDIMRYVEVNQSVEVNAQHGDCFTICICIQG